MRHCKWVIDMLMAFIKFGWAVLLDPLWRPGYTHTSNTSVLLRFVCSHILTRNAKEGERVDDGRDMREEGDLPETVPWNNGNRGNDKRMLIEAVRYFGNDDVATFVDQMGTKILNE